MSEDQSLSAPALQGSRTRVCWGSGPKLGEILGENEPNEQVGIIFQSSLSPMFLQCN